MRRLVLLIALVAAAIAVFYLVRERSAPPEVPFARAVREEIVSTLATNGKVQPVEWAEAHAESGGAVSRTFIKKGQHVAQGASLVELDSRPAANDLSAAEARVAQAQAELQTLRQGGRPAELSTIEGSLLSVRQELEVAEREVASLERLRAKGAATADEVRVAKDRAGRASVQIQGLESRRKAQVGSPDIASAEGRLREAEAAVNAARVRIAMSTVRAPTAGTVYQFDLRPGAYLNPGDLVAGIGKLDRVRVLVYVDEPDLGRVEVGKQATINWDAMPERTWKGVVDRLPTEITAMGSRQVGEVSTVIDNPDHGLLPGTNVNVAILVKTVKSTVVVPTAAIRREAGKTGVFLLSGGRIVWRDVKTGVASAARTEVEGVQDTDSVVLPTDRPLKADMAVRPVYP